MSRRTPVHVLGAITGAAIVLAGAGGYKLWRALEAGGEHERAVVFAPLLSSKAFQQRSGVRVVRVAVTGGGGLLDLRYRVVDPEAALTLHAAGSPQVVDERTGVLVDQLLMDHMHHGTLKIAHTYYVIFDNPGNLVRRGSQVTVQLGGARLAHVPVQ